VLPSRLHRHKRPSSVDGGEVSRIAEYDPPVTRVDRSSPVLVGLTALLLYAAWVGWAHHIGHDWRDWAAVGRHFVGASETSPAIAGDAPHATNVFGYDGQFFLYIARDPAGAVPYLDDASYRYGRIVYPLAARGLALGRQAAIPFALILVNLLAIAVGTWAVAAWLRRERFAEWFALLYAAFPGVFFGLWRDLSEPLAYALTAVALLVFDGDRPRRIALSAALFAVAILTREGAAVFMLVWAAALAVQGRRLRAALFAVGSLLPYVAYRFVFLNLWLGNAGLPGQVRPTPVPFGGMGHYFPWGGVELQRAYAVLLPGTFCVALALAALRRGARAPAVWALLANALVFVVFLPAAAYQDYASAGRISTGVFLAFLLSLPALARVFPTTRAWMWLPMIAWFAPWYVLLPLAFDAHW
jgi:hypothetical protein